MLKKIVFILFSFCLFASCDKEEVVEPAAPESVKNTTIMFFPWSTNLKYCFLQNIDDFHKLIRKNKLYNERLLVCIESSVGVVDILELKDKSDIDTLQTYMYPRFTSPEGITKFLNIIHDFSPSETYSMIVGCHGTAWLPASVNTETRCSFSDNSSIPLTRYIGGTTKEFQIEISTLREGIENSMIPKFEYILFDDCYMANVEVAYELRGVCNHIIASPTEIMAYGFPYYRCGNYLLGNRDYEKVCEVFYDFYSNYDIPCGTIAVVDCSEMDSLARVMKKIHDLSPALDTTNAIQRMDGYDPALFLDFGDYVNHLVITDSLLHEEFELQLERAVPYKRNTRNYFSTFIGIIPIDKYSGITTSVSSRNTVAEKIVETSWYIDTH